MDDYRITIHLFVKKLYTRILSFNFLFPFFFFLYYSFNFQAYLYLDSLDSIGSSEY